MTTTASVNRNAPAHGIPFREAVRVWAKIAALSFGGPAGQIAVMHRILVEQKRWIGEARFLHALNYCMLLPGPEAQQLATYIGWLLHGRRGALTAGILFVLPGAFVMLGLSLAYALGRGLEYYDMPAVRKIVRDAKTRDFRFSSIVLGIVRSTPFQMKETK